ncbi:MAG TPA: MIP/aquaporin family protein [Planctomycetota bacterium]|nr:MIP/aquaporin family protein [Planctomycetota bacterium]
MTPARLSHACIAETIGTFILVFFGTGSVFVGVLTGAIDGVVQVGLVWGLGIGLAIYAVGAVSGAHLNPAVTVAMAALKRLPPARIVPYVAAQLVGAFLASAILYGLFSGVLAEFEAKKGLVRGQPGSELSAMVFGEYFPNPAIFGTDEAAFRQVSSMQAMAAEAIGTCLLVFFILALTDTRNRSRPNGTSFAPFIGLTVAVIIAVVAPLTQAGLNPARDFAPRLFSYFVGWGDIAIPGPRGGFLTVYIIAPILGGCVGAAIYQLLIGRSFGISSAPAAEVPKDHGDSGMDPDLPRQRSLPASS